MGVVIGRHVNNITLNDLEYVLNDNDTVREFKDKDEAVQFLMEAGAHEDDIQYYKFIDVDTEKEIGDD